MQILRASEDYLETMLMMKEKHGYIRSIDIAEYLGVTKPSVSYATKRLRENGYMEGVRSETLYPVFISDSLEATLKEAGLQCYLAAFYRVD